MHNTHCYDTEYYVYNLAKHNLYSKLYSIIYLEEQNHRSLQKAGGTEIYESKTRNGKMLDWPLFLRDRRFSQLPPRQHPLRGPLRSPGLELMSTCLRGQVGCWVQLHAPLLRCAGSRLPKA